MAETRSQGQTDKKAAEDRTAQVAADSAAERDRQQREAAEAEPRSAAAKSLQVDAADAVNPYPNYDMMTLDQLRELAKSRGVEINRDVEQAHLITELRAADTQT